MNKTRLFAMPVNYHVMFFSNRFFDVLLFLLQLSLKKLYKISPEQHNSANRKLRFKIAKKIYLPWLSRTFPPKILYGGQLFWTSPFCSHYKMSIEWVNFLNRLGSISNWILAFLVISGDDLRVPHRLHHLHQDMVPSSPLDYFSVPLNA
jgi:hypothetical protein